MSIDRTSALKPVSTVQPRETNEAARKNVWKTSTANSTSVTLSDAQSKLMQPQQRYQHGTC